MASRMAASDSCVRSNSSGPAVRGKAWESTNISRERTRIRSNGASEPGKLPARSGRAKRDLICDQLPSGFTRMYARNTGDAPPLSMRATKSTAQGERGRGGARRGGESGDEQRRGEERGGELRRRSERSTMRESHCHLLLSASGAASGAASEQLAVCIATAHSAPQPPICNARACLLRRPEAHRGASGCRAKWRRTRGISR